MIPPAPPAADPPPSPTRWARLAPTGQLLTTDGPRTDLNDVTTVTYYPANDACIGCRGQLQTQTNALGHSTQYTAYNGRGQPTALTAPNGQTTTWEYDLRGRLLRQTTGSDVTTYTYDLAGRLLTQTQPDGTPQTYRYDTQDRLSEVRDAAGNTTRHTYNALGQRLKTEILDAAGVLTQQQSYTYDTQGRLVASIDGLGHSTTYAYDPEGQLLSSTDPQGRSTTHSYDPLGRRTQSRDPLGGLLATTYDSQDQPLSITDPRGLSTHADPNVWGEVQRLDSPDTRSTVTSYDPAGNPLQQIDARGVSSTRRFDALNRPLSQQTPATAVTYSYDRGTNGKGLLTSLQDSSGTQSYTYSKRRQITQHTITLNGLAPLTLGYGYGKGGRLSRISYPSGRTATWHYRADGTLSQLRTTYAGSTQTLLKTTWSPTGQPERLTYGNGLVERRSYDLAGQLTQLHRNALGKLNYRYDTVGNITQIGTQTYAYDALDRLTQAPSRSYAYDANGNRIQDTGQSYTLAPDSNRLHQGAGRVYDYDANGNPMSDGRYSYTYDSQNRLTEVQQGATVQVRSTYNALGQRVRKETAAGTTHYLYSTEGQLLAELDAQGNTHREYLYLHAWPVAVVSYTPAVPAGSGAAALLAGDAAAETAEDYPEVAETAPADPKPTTSTGVTTSGATDRAADGAATSTAATPAIQLHYLHPDHLGTPRLATDSAQRVVWRWDSAPFGDTPAQEDPDGDGVRVTLNLRFPGQYFDAETGLHYNYFRDYDPVVGRYLESDPIGLRGGVGTYGYVENDPLSFFDPNGHGKTGNHRRPNLSPWEFGMKICTTFPPHTFICVDGKCAGKYPESPYYKNSICGGGIIKDDSAWATDSNCSDIPIPCNCDEGKFKSCLLSFISRIGYHTSDYTFLSTNCGQWAVEAITICRKACLI